MGGATERQRPPPDVDVGVVVHLLRHLGHPVHRGDRRGKARQLDRTHDFAAAGTLSRAPSVKLLQRRRDRLIAQHISHEAYRIPRATAALAGTGTMSRWSALAADRSRGGSGWSPIWRPLSGTPPFRRVSGFSVGPPWARSDNP